LNLQPDIAYNYPNSATAI